MQTGQEKRRLYLHAAPAHPEAVDGEGSKVVAKESHRGVQEVVLQQPHQVGPRVDHVDELALEQLVPVCSQHTPCQGTPCTSGSGLQTTHSAELHNSLHTWTTVPGVRLSEVYDQQLAVKVSEKVSSNPGKISWAQAREGKSCFIYR